jgi:hypothetical protein
VKAKTHILVVDDDDEAIGELLGDFLEKSWANMRSLAVPVSRFA